MLKGTQTKRVATKNWMIVGMAYLDSRDGWNIVHRHFGAPAAQHDTIIKRRIKLAVSLALQKQADLACAGDRVSFYFPGQKVRVDVTGT